MVEKDPAQIVEVSDSSWKKDITEKSFVRKILHGLILVLPVAILIFLISILFNLLIGILMPLSTLIHSGSEEPGLAIHVISAAILLLLLYLLGDHTLGRKGKGILYRFEENVLVKVPLYSTIRDLVRQFTGVKEMPFAQVCLVDPFGNGVLMTGFISDRYEEEFYTVFVPTAPNPTNGNIYHVPAEKIKLLDISTETAMRTIVGMGAGSSCLYNLKGMKDLSLTSAES